MSRATEEALSALHGALAKSLTDKILNGEATAADLNVARAFLKDNNIDVAPSTAKVLPDLAKLLPFAVPADNPAAEIEAAGL